ncbi:hypothetical protein ACHAW5_007036 [Stephanodiscus triporus]|uniref:Pyrroline-5-carboxylate reductase catalytic N-terminal domain-containing protein n=1 Tax=Stephanodiscus triporus TaxID=2934178 RepID=A0ABD3NUS5_9STRA
MAIGRRYGVRPSIRLLLLPFLVVVAFAGPSPRAVEAVGATFITYDGIASIERRRRRRPMTLVAPAPAAADDDDPSSSRAARTNRETLRPIRAGLVGCGTIAASIAIGLAEADHVPHLARFGLRLSSISVTRRSESKSRMLEGRFPKFVTVYESAWEVVAECDLVFLCVLPDQVDGVLADLAERGVWRREDHTLVSLVSTSKVEDLIERTGLRRNSVFKLICLPPISRRGGCALLQPAPVPSPTTTTPDGSDDDRGDDDASSSRARSDEDDANIVKSILNALGGYVECRDDSVMDAMMVTTCMMGPMYGVMRNNRDWLVSPEDASYFVGRSYLSMVQDAERDCDVNPRRFDDLIDEQTPGGLNEQALGNLHRQGVFNSYDRAMDAVLSRLRGESDGSLPPDCT